MTPAPDTITGIAPELIATPRGNVEIARWGRGPALLLLHGAMGGWDQGLMLGRAGVGPEGFEFLAVSRPGYLGTPLASGKAPGQQADLCAAVMDALGIREAGVAAVSGGGPCALQFALRHPARCRALVTISACSAQLTAGVPLRFRLLLRMAHFPALLARMTRKAAENPEAALRRAIPDAALRARTLSDPEVGPLLRENQLSILRNMARRLPGTRNDIVQTHAPFAYPFEAIGAPALVVHGSEDEAVPFEQAESLAARLPLGELLAIPGGRHLSLFTHRRIIQPHVAEFLRRACQSHLR